MRRNHPEAAVQLSVTAAVGLAVTLLAVAVGWSPYAPLLGWDVAAVVYLAWTWRTIWPLDATQTARLAVREDPNRRVAHAVLLGACVASLLAVGFLLAQGSARSGTGRGLLVAAGVVSVVLSWAVVHTLYTTRYAHVYYTGPDGGLVFHQVQPPRYRDFAYVAFTVGMTFQVSDTDVTDPEMRRNVLWHALLSYLFGAAIVAATVNLLASLAR